MRQAFTIAGRMDGLNEYTRACRANRYAGADMKKRNQAVAAKAIRDAGIVPHRGRARIRFTWVEPNPRRDPDNVRFAAKFILDALVAEGIIEDDGQQVIGGIEDAFMVNAANPRIEVEIRGA